MGLKAVILIIILLAIGYLILTGGEIDINIGTNNTSTTLWTNQNFTNAATNPLDHKGDKVSLDLLVFNQLNASGKTGVEAYMGTTQQLQDNPTDESRRVYISYDPTTTTPPQPGDCIHVTGTIQGQAHITTLDGDTVNVTYIQATQITQTTCNP